MVHVPLLKNYYMRRDTTPPPDCLSLQDLAKIAQVLVVLCLLCSNVRLCCREWPLDDGSASLRELA